MPPPSATLLEPRKSPVQARSAASVEAILEATVQVLVSVGKERLTTTRVAERAGVSVGTLYQYFPNKTALLQAALRRHLEAVTNAIDRVCQEQRGHPLEEMATALITTFLDAKMRNAKASVAMYSISADVDGMKIARQIGLHSGKVVAAMFATTSDPPLSDPALVASMLTSAMAGISRRLLEGPSPEKHVEPLKQELIFLARAYLKACSAR
ncbi:TetR/AcrR family transcriptional regulator [Granulicella aggregans]|uniref:TetR/AcrR family transcriptional regulator n=1 Tax=Granulicella aggregans TaxID=474949 RepID=UPI0021DF4EF0|nr:TetR/AcrR family transcriptional regulator [Granulicella aggregans]